MSGGQHGYTMLKRMAAPKVDYGLTYIGHLTLCDRKVCSREATLCEMV